MDDFCREAEKISVNPSKRGTRVDHEQSTIQLVKWAPQGQAFAMVHDGDIYYKSSPKDATVHRLTNSGEPGVVFNGIPDWLYEGKKPFCPQIPNRTLFMTSKLLQSDYSYK